ncbi:hypothetical protein [Pedobacter changchengzhani]|uniref:hypothetical protein n=1 Tax=Pedobacter changchengzhani TaxID=2529274 RepID=UPI0014050C88|nr:hypothetical protein [Pedobacter changchengzhani]
MFFQIFFALLLTFSSPKQTNINNNTATANRSNVDESDNGPKPVSGENGQINPPRRQD